MARYWSSVSWFALLALISVASASAISAQEHLVSYFGIVGEDAASGLSVSVNTAALAVDPAFLLIELPDHTTRTAVRDGAERRSATSLVWRGRFEGQKSSRVVLTLHGEHVVGRFDGLDPLFVLEPTQIGHRFEAAGLRAYDPAGEPLPARTNSGILQPSLASVDPVDGIDVMVVYSPEARIGAGGTNQIEAIAQAAVDNTNTAFIDSDMNARFVLVHTSETVRSEVGGSLSADLEWVASNAGVAALRDLHKADMVGLLVNSGSYCGRGYVMRNPEAGFEDSAFQVTKRSCAVGNLTYAHEHGHNLGFEHDPANGPNPANASYPWSFGHFVNGSYRTVMSYSNQCGSGCSRAPHFSNPSVAHNGTATGIANQRDNARSGDSVAPIVTDFRLRDAPPDLIVNGLNVSDSTPATDQSVTVSATVENQGASNSDATTLRYYRSSDTSISTADTEMSSDSVASLNAGDIASLSDVNTIATAGTYWVGACVDSVVNESDTANNCSPGVQVVVHDPCTEDITVQNETVSGVVNHQSCSILRVGPDWTVTSTGDATLQAKGQVILYNGISVQSGGQLTVSD